MTRAAARGDEGSGELGVFVDHEIRLPRACAREQVGRAACSRAREIVEPRRLSVAAQLCMCGPDRPCIQSAALDVLPHVGSARDDGLMAGTPCGKREWQQRVQMAAQGVADEQDAHGRVSKCRANFAF